MRCSKQQIFQHWKNATITGIVAHEWHHKITKEIISEVWRHEIKEKPGLGKGMPIVDSKNHDQTRCVCSVEICGPWSGLVVCYFKNPQLGRDCHGDFNLWNTQLILNQLLPQGCKYVNFRERNFEALLKRKMRKKGTRWAPTSYKWSYVAPINGFIHG